MYCRSGYVHYKGRWCHIYTSPCIHTPHHIYTQPIIYTNNSYHQIYKQLTSSHTLTSSCTDQGGGCGAGISTRCHILPQGIYFYWCCAAFTGFVSVGNDVSVVLVWCTVELLNVFPVWCCVECATPNTAHTHTHTHTHQIQVAQLREIFGVRWSVFLLYPAGCGKSAVWRTLARAQQLAGEKTITRPINPKVCIVVVGCGCGYGRKDEGG